MVISRATYLLKQTLSSTHQYRGCNGHRALSGVLRIAIRETQTQVKPEECFREEKESGGRKDKSHKVVHVAW